MEHFRVRLNCIDSYQSPPTRFDPQLQNVTASQRRGTANVPVIRVFGSTETGQKVCAHIHGAFPYMYIEYGGSLLNDEVNAYIYQLQLSIDHALSVSYRRNEKNLARYVAKITLVKGIPFYGFHVGYQYFLKIYTFDPIVTTRLADLLRQGAVMNEKLQPYESHIQYLPQWMMDYNLYGCAYIDCSKVHFRSPIPMYDEMENHTHLWHEKSIPPELVLNEMTFPRVSHCAIEVDICVHDIINRRDIKSRHLHHDFFAGFEDLKSGQAVPSVEDSKNGRDIKLPQNLAGLEDIKSRRLVPSLEDLWKAETRRRKSQMSNAPAGSSPFPPEVMISMSADPRNSQPGGWIHEEEYRDLIEELVHGEKADDDTKVSFDTFVDKEALESTIQTALDSVEDLYPEKLKSPSSSMSKSDPGLQPGGDARDINIRVDERQALSLQRYDELEIYSDEEDLRQEELALRADGNQEDMPIEDDKKTVIGSAAGNKSGKASRALKIHAGDNSQYEPSSSSEAAFQAFSNGNEANFSEKRPTKAITPLDSHVGDDAQYEPSSSAEAAFQAFTLENEDLYREHPQESLLYRKESSRRPHRRPYPLDAELPASKRLRRQDQRPESEPKIEYQELDETEPEDERHSLDWRSSQPRTVHSNLFQARSKSKMVPDGSAVLNFPVVKDPNDPSTVLRLSQQCSQKSVDGIPGNAHEIEHAGGKGLNGSISSSEQNSHQSSGVMSAIKNLSVSLSKDFSHDEGQLLLYNEIPLTSSEVVETMIDNDLLPMLHQGAHYSKDADVPNRQREYAGKGFRLDGLSAPYLPDFDPSGETNANGKKRGALERDRDEKAFQSQRSACELRSWEIAEPPPSFEEVEKWLTKEIETEVHIQTSNRSHTSKEKLSQIEGPTQHLRKGFGSSGQNLTSVRHETQYMSTMSLEVHVNTRGAFVPNPEQDTVQCIFWSFQSDNADGTDDSNTSGIVVLSEDETLSRSISKQVRVEVFGENTELDLLLRIVEIVRALDPDVLTGYEVHGGSWGYLMERARFKYDFDLANEFSRMRTASHGRFGKDNDTWGFNTTSSLRVTGRHMINVWRAMRGEMNLTQYTMENVVFQLMRRRIPHYSWKDLSAWYLSGDPKDLSKVLKYYLTRVHLDLEILDRNDIIPRTSEQARLLGVDFFSVFSRGSQFKVESLMFRIAKPENFILVSPSKRQVAGQNALECLPLVMEPQSAFYPGPLLVLDFQSLYPSVMIAYNYCYSTFLGRVVRWRGANKMGFTEYKRQRRLLELLKDHVNIAPNGMIYVKQSIRKSLLAKMLTEILETRVMVKSGMKVEKDDAILQRLLNNRQLALKLIANVTYGYTSASFSGRMPCSEIADSIVQTGRETLERAIALIHSVKRWGAEVVYGDTDSLFIYLKGRTKDQAFDIGEDIAKTITNMNPRPVKLKFEKVYYPSVLLAKKRYVGYKYESRDQTVPEFDAKGIETVRRDGTPAEQKIEEKALRILFETADLSQVKTYFQRQCEKIMKGSISVQDFCFAREVKLGTYSDKGPPPPGALISTRKMMQDARAEPQYGERVPYVVVVGAPGARLIDRCISPEELLTSSHLELDAEYYISKNIIPPLERIFNLVGANVRGWYDEMPKFQRIRRTEAGAHFSNKPKGFAVSKRTLESYMKSSLCMVCNSKKEMDGPICAECIANGAVSMLRLQQRLNNEARKLQDLERICRSCSGISWIDEVKCDSKDCPVFYSRTRQMTRLRTDSGVLGHGIQLLESANAAAEAALGW